MKKMLSVTIVALLCFSTLSTCIPQVMGWASIIPPIDLHEKMALDALRGTGWSHSDSEMIALFAGRPDMPGLDPDLRHCHEASHRVTDYQRILEGFGGAECTARGAEEMAISFVGTARDFYVSGQIVEALAHLGCAIHFIQDAVCPAHVFPFSGEWFTWMPWWWVLALDSPPDFNFEAYTASAYVLRNWPSLVRSAEPTAIVNLEDLKTKIEEAADRVYALPCSYVRQNREIFGGSDDIIGDPSHVTGWDMSDENIATCMVEAAKLVKAAAMWVKGYEIGRAVDVVLVIDRSGSMWGSKIRSARVSASFFTDLMHVGDYLGVVSYSYGSRVDYQLSELTSADTRIAVKNRINQISASGMTAMGDGLRAAYNQLANYGNPSHPWAIVLMSNGWHNWGREHPYNVIPDLRARNIGVYTIGLGSGADGTLLGHIASETGGFYRFAATPDDLLAIYHDIAATVTQEQTVSSTRSSVAQGQTTQTSTMVDSSVVQATFSVSWGGSDLDLTLLRPDGELIDPNAAATNPDIEYVEEVRYEMYRIGYPMSGIWTMIVAGVNVPVGGEDFVAKLSVVADATLTLSTDEDSYTFPQPIRIIAAIEDWGTPILGANAEVSITRPDSSLASIILYDDGSSIHGDETADDGVYVNYFDDYSEDGSYTIRVEATGITSTEEPFRRQAEKTVLVLGIPTDNTPPHTNLFIGSPQFIKPSGDIYVTSTTLFTLEAVDNNGAGSGVADTAYRIYNATYDTGWTVSVPPVTFQLTMLWDGAYRIDYYSTDNAGNVESTNTEIAILDNNPPEIAVSNPSAGWALQDGVTFLGSITDAGSGVSSMSFSIREQDGGIGTQIGYEDLPVSYDPAAGQWSFSFDTLLVPDGYYVLYIEAEDNLGNEASTTVPYSIRNWAVIELLPSSQNNKAGRTMPVKFALRVAAEVDPDQPFVYNEELRIEIFATADQDNVLQESYCGDTARDYRISSVLYVTNFKTIKRTPMEYTVAIYRDTFDVGSFTFETVK